MLSIDPGSVKLSALPSLPLVERRQLPEFSGIYFVVSSDDKVLYIGRSNNIAQRWVGHHRYWELENIKGTRIAWLLVSDTSLLPSIESALILHFQPVLNKRLIQKRKKGKPGNPNPSVKTRFTHSKQPRLSHRTRSVRLDPETDNFIEALPNSERTVWLRRVITEAVQRELGKTEAS